MLASVNCPPFLVCFAVLCLFLISSQLHLQNSTVWHFQHNGDGEKVCWFNHLQTHCTENACQWEFTTPEIRCQYTPELLQNNIFIKLQCEGVMVLWNATVMSFMPGFYSFIDIKVIQCTFTQLFKLLNLVRLLNNKKTLPWSNTLLLN